MNNYLPILAIESSAELCSAAIMFNDGSYVDENITGKHVHSEKLLTTVESVLNNSNLTITKIKSIAISIGPGSFTGLRIGMSTAKGLAFGANLPLIPVPTYSALALQVCEDIEINGKFVIANSVNNEELYVAEFKREAEYFSEVKTVHLIKKKDYNENNYPGYTLIGNYEGAKTQKGISAPNSLFVARWAYLFGKDLLTSNYDYLEPNYIKNFIVKVKK